MTESVFESTQVLKATLNVVQSRYYFADSDDLEKCDAGYQIAEV